MNWRQEFDLPEDTPEHWREFYESLRPLKELSDEALGQMALERLDAMYESRRFLGIRQIMDLRAKHIEGQREVAQLWHCKRCRRPQPAQLEHGKAKVRVFRNGYVAVFLACGHTAAVRLDRINEKEVIQ